MPQTAIIFQREFGQFKNIKFPRGNYQIPRQKHAGRFLLTFTALKSH